MKKAFTLGEMLVCIGIMASLILLFLTTINAKPNSNMVMFRKAYNIISNTVLEMLKTEAYYNNGMLDNTMETSHDIEGEKPSGAKKFCKVFLSYVNTAGSADCSASADKPTFETLDGITWYLPPKTTPGTFAGKETIRVDVNGSVNAPNCLSGSDGCKNPDIFEIKVSNIGKIYIDDATAKEYLQRNVNIKRK